MIERHKKSILSMLDQIHKARQNPYENINKWLEIQESLIKKHFYVEKKYRSHKKEIASLNKIRKDPNNRISKEDSLTVKTIIRQRESAIEEYKKLIDIYKSIGDGIAFTFLNKFDIKPQNFKESAGFISDKIGFKNEIKALRYSYSKGLIAILHDITSVLKYSDLTIVSEHKAPLAIEMKTSNNINPRTERQKEKANSIYSYLTNDTTENLYDNGGETKRLALRSPEINYVNNINKLIEQAEKEGTSSELIEEGLLYIVSYKVFSPEKYTKIFEESKITDPLNCMLLAGDIIGQGYFPLSLSISNPQHYLDFINEKIAIMIVCDFSYIKKIANQNNFTVDLCDDSDWMFEFKSTKTDIPLSHFKMSYHLFLRLSNEFVSLKWLFEDCFENIKEFNFN